jgi:hypothetical protein
MKTKKLKFKLIILTIYLSFFSTFIFSQNIGHVDNAKIKTVFIKVDTTKVKI